MVVAASCLLLVCALQQTDSETKRVLKKYLESMRLDDSDPFEMTMVAELRQYWCSAFKTKHRPHRTSVEQAINHKLIQRRNVI